MAPRHPAGHPAVQRDRGHGRPQQVHREHVHIIDDNNQDGIIDHKQRLTLYFYKLIDVHHSSVKE